MKAYEIMNILFSMADMSGFENTCDTLKCGQADKEVKKAAVTMFPTVEVIKQAQDWGADLLVVHEPLYYNHMDKHSDDPVEIKKRELLESTDMTVYRYHDHPHIARPDMISVGMFEAIGLDGEYEYEADGLVRYHLKNEITPRELAAHMEEKLNIKHLRIAGSIDTPCKVLSGKFGSPGGVGRELRNDKSEIMLIGEVCEWADCEYARDAAQLGFKKAIIAMGHIPSERDGMKYIAGVLKEKCPDLTVKYFESGEVFQYT
ncbi:MAG: Nif3-like dinuclear metal center hexameric protein [Clostridia bacterium]|nr:Nif3-like dinuclear metal center hexameric protein [Clostridia bacterium]